MSRPKKASTLPLLTGATKFLVTGSVAFFALIILRLFNVTTFFYLVLGIVAGVGFAIAAIILFANIYARRTGRYQNLASRYTTYQYLSQQDIDDYDLQLASTKSGLLFFLVEVVCYMVIVGGAFLLTVFFTPVM